MKRSAALFVVVSTLAAAAPAAAGPIQSWDKVIDKAASRFKVLAQFDGEAVLDKETGLVWELAPATGTFDWASSAKICLGTPTGGRRGWRLPTAWELMTLSDPSQDDPSLPVGHPFQNVSAVDLYWSSTADPEIVANAMGERFGTGGGGIISTTKTTLSRRWCVRGPGGQYGGQG